MNKELIIKIINEVIKENFIITSNKGSLGLNHNKKIFKKYKLLYNDIFKHSEYLYIFKNKNNIDKLLNEMFCKCGNKNNFINQSCGYHKHCSLKCRSNDKEVNEKKKLTYLKHFGVEHNWKNKECYEKGRQTRKLLYDDPNYNNREKCKNTCLAIYGVDNPNKCRKVREKIENTNMERYGVKHNWSSKDPKLNGQATNEILYGAKNFYATQQFKNKYKDEEWVKQRQRKIDETKKKNNSFKKSMQEDQCYNLLCKKFKKVERQYKSELYPFKCDLYIPQKDLYIECNFYWTHHPIKNKCKPFKHSVEDLENIEKLKEKAKEINFKNQNKNEYLTAINVWIKRDPLKLQTFKQNKLKFKIFYTIQQFLNWYSKI